MQKSRRLDFLWRVILVFLGCLICAVGVNLFLVPFKLITAGVSGLALLIHYIFPVLTPSLWVVIINVPIFIAGWFLVDKAFTIWSLFGMVCFSAILEATSGLAQMPVVNDLYAALIMGGLLAGIGVGMVFRARASLGGTDILAAMVRKYYSTSIGAAQFGLNGVIVVGLGVLFTFQEAFASGFSILVESWAMDRVIMGLFTNKAVMAITNKPDEVGHALMDKLGRGVTYLHSQGGMSKTDKRLVYCVVPPRQLMQAKGIIEEIDPDSFTTVQDVSEVLGKGFRRPVI